MTTQAELWTRILSLLNRDTELDLRKAVAEAMRRTKKKERTPLAALAEALGKQLLYVDWKTTQDDYLGAIAKYVASRGGSCDFGAVFNRSKSAVQTSPELDRELGACTEGQSIVVFDSSSDTYVFATVDKAEALSLLEAAQELGITIYVPGLKAPKKARGAAAAKLAERTKLARRLLVLLHQNAALDLDAAAAQLAEDPQKLGEVLLGQVFCIETGASDEVFAFQLEAFIKARGGTLDVGKILLSEDTQRASKVARKGFLTELSRGMEGVVPVLIDKELQLLGTVARKHVREFKQLAEKLKLRMVIEAEPVPTPASKTAPLTRKEIDARRVAFNKTLPSVRFPPKPTRDTRRPDAETYWPRVQVRILERIEAHRENGQTEAKKWRERLHQDSFFTDLIPLHIDLFMARYSAGEDVDTILADVLEIFGRFPPFVKKERSAVGHTAHHHIVRFVSLMILAKPPKALATAFAKAYETLWRQRTVGVTQYIDPLIEAMLNHLDPARMKRRVPRGKRKVSLRLPYCFGSLWQALAPATKPEHRASHMKRFLRDYHTGLETEYGRKFPYDLYGDTYVGDWYPEAAAVTLIAGLDDSRFRNDAHYPGELIGAPTVAPKVAPTVAPKKTARKKSAS